MSGAIVVLAQTLQTGMRNARDGLEATVSSCSISLLRCTTSPSRTRSVGLAAVLLTCLGAGVAIPAAHAQQGNPASPPAVQPLITGRTGCGVPKELARFDQPLPLLASSVIRDGKALIIALGSSSTAGAGASSPLESYPARLDTELDKRFPGTDFLVANYGKGGLLAKDMLEAIHARVIALKPALVIWQTGVNDAIQAVGVDQFKAVLLTGVRDLKAAGIDVILVNHQYYPRAERVPGYADYLAAMRDVAQTERVPLFRRFAIMKHLIKSGQHTTETLLAPDHFHLNDLSYGCLAELLAEAIEDRIKTGRLTASR